jgi:hypothetical protein
VLFHWLPLWLLEQLQLLWQLLLQLQQYGLCQFAAVGAVVDAEQYWLHFQGWVWLLRWVE